MRQYAKNFLANTDAVYSVPSTETTLLKSISIRNFKLEYIEAITQNYKTLIGEGGFGSVYRGSLPDGEEVAVKVRSATSTQGIREFNNEVPIHSIFRPISSQLSCSHLTNQICYLKYEKNISTWSEQ